MEIIFGNEKLRKCCTSINKAIREWGDVRGRLVMRRLDQIRWAENLKDLMTLPQANCHPLKGNREGQFAVNVEHPFRLIFEPANEPLPGLNDGGLDLTRITFVRILEVKDYHG